MDMYEGRGTFGEAIQVPIRSFGERVAWCRDNVPDEHPPFAAVAGQMLKAAGVKVTPDSIRARLKTTGWDMESLTREDAA